MAKKSVTNTALGAAVCRLIEQYQPANIRLFDDPVVMDLVGRSIRLMLNSGTMRSFTIRQTDAITPGVYGVQICRTRYIDEAVRAAISQRIGQVVILGAGFDTRPYRLVELQSIPVFEVDLPSVQEEKKKGLIQHFGRLPGNVTFVSIDFDTQTLATAFAGTSFDSSRQTLFLWEGVTQYLTEIAIKQTLSFVGRSAPGSLIVFTYVLKSVVERRSDIPGANKMMDRVAKSSPWIFGLEPSGIQVFLQPFHLSMLEDIGGMEYQQRYLLPLKRNLPVFPGERILRAVVHQTVA